MKTRVFIELHVRWMDTPSPILFLQHKTAFRWSVVVLGVRNRRGHPVPVQWTGNSTSKTGRSLGEKVRTEALLGASQGGSSRTF